MNWKGVLTVVLVAGGCLGNVCHKFVCRDPVDEQNPDICSMIEKPDGETIIQYVGNCEKGKTCHIAAVGDTPERCRENPEYYKHPGQKCKDSEQCIGTIQDGFCRGKNEGEACDSHIDCDANLACDSTGHCVQAKDLGGHCDSEYLYCKTYLYCKEGECVPYGSVPRHENPGGHFPDLCASHYINSKGQCDEGPRLKGEIFVDSPESKCVYSNDEEINAVCAYHKDGKAICRPGEADLQSYWQDVLTYLDGKPVCPAWWYMGQCDYSQLGMDWSTYKKGRLGYYLMDAYVYTQGMPECVQQYINPDYWELRNSASHLALALALALSLILLLL